MIFGLLCGSKKLQMISYSLTPVEEIHDSVTQAAGVQVLIKREYLNHPHVSGNKWWKLKYNLEEAKRQGKNTLLTFGGAYSNHIYATAAAANEIGFKSIGIIRGEEVLPLNPTLSFARQKGMQLEYVARDVYRKKTEQSFIHELENKFGDFYLIPEGGTNDLAVKGCLELGEELSKIKSDYICLPVGTGGTMAGIVSGVSNGKVLGFSVLKGENFLHEEVARLITAVNPATWEIIQDYHFGGYAKVNDDLKKFISSFEHQHALPLDPVYTGKMMFGIWDLLKKNFFARASTILILHTGGLQGKSAD